MSATKMNAGMFKKTSLLAIIYALCLSFSLATGQNGAAPPASGPSDSSDSSDSSDKALQERIARLIVQLGSDKFDEREAAEAALIEIGDDNYDAVREAATQTLKNPDAEIAARAEAILKRLNEARITFVFLDEKGSPLKKQKCFISVCHEARFASSSYEYVPWVALVTGTATNERGEIALPSMPELDNRFLIKAEGYPQIDTATSTYQAGRHVIRVRLLPGGTVSGRVIDPSRNDRPIVNATVRIGDVSAQTDENGRFKLENALSGLQWLITLAPKEGPYNWVTSQRVYVKSGETVETVVRHEVRMSDEAIELEAPRADCIFALPDGSPLSSRVVRSELKPERPYYNHPGYFDEKQRMTVSGGNGAVRIAIPRSGKCSITLYVAGYKPLDLPAHDFKYGEQWTLEKPLILEKGLTAKVGVKDQDGKPLAKARVIARKIDRGRRYINLGDLAGNITHARSEHWGIAESDESGTADISGLEEGRTAFRAICEGYITSEISEVELKKGEDSVVTLQLVKAASASVQVLDAETKNPVPDVHIYVWPLNDIWPVDVDTIRIFDERYAVERIEPGRRYLIASATGYWNNYCVDEWKPGERKNQTILMKKIGVGSVSGRIQATESMPITNVNYAVTYPLVDRDINFCPLVVRLLRDGSFYVAGLQEGIWAFTVRDVGENIIGGAIFQIEQGKTAEVTVPLQRGVPLEISVIGPDGKPAEDAYVSISAANETNLIQSRLAKSLLSADPYKWYSAVYSGGHCRFDHVPEGKYIVRVDTNATTLNVSHDDVQAGKTVAITIDLRKTGSIEGMVAQKPAGMCRARLALYTGWAGSVYPENCREVDVAEDGSFKFENVLAGEYIIYDAMSSCAKVSPPYLRVEVKAGEVTKGVSVALTTKCQKFSGRFANYKLPNPALYASLVLAGDGCYYYANVRPDGSFEVAAPPGRYKLLLRDILRPARIMNPIEITIEDGKDLADIEIP